MIPGAHAAHHRRKQITKRETHEKTHEREFVEGRGSAAKEMREIQVESSSPEATTRAAFCRHVSWMMNLGSVNAVSGQSGGRGPCFPDEITPNEKESCEG